MCDFPDSLDVLINLARKKGLLYSGFMSYKYIKLQIHKHTFLSRILNTDFLLSDLRKKRLFKVEFITA